MKMKLYWIAMIPFSMLMFACNNGKTDSTNTDSTANARLEKTGENIKEAANTAVDNAKQAITGNPDSSFVAKTTMRNQHEIMLLQAGMRMGTSKELKSHAKMMLADHQKLAKKLEDYANSKHYAAIDKGNEKAADDMDDMKDKKGADWDKAWIDKLEDGHKDNIKAFEDARNDVKDTELKALIDNTLPTLHHHLDMVTTLKDQMK